MLRNHVKKWGPPGLSRMVSRSLTLKLQSPVCCVMKMTHSSRDLRGVVILSSTGWTVGSQSSAHFKQSSWDCSGFIEKSILERHPFEAHLLPDNVPFIVGRSHRAGPSVDHSGLYTSLLEKLFPPSLSVTHFSFLVTSGTSLQYSDIYY